MTMTKTRWRALLVATLLLLGTLAMNARADAATNPYQRGPNPTLAMLQASSGPYAYSRVSVSDLSTPGFGSATIYYPNSTSEGTFGGVAVSPGFTGTESSISWYGPRLASNGFVVITFNTQSLFDQPSSRATQLLAALDYLVNTSSVRTRVDRNRLAVMGHSMGGGGSIEAAARRPSLQAAIPLTPWHTDKTWPEVRTPTLIVGAQSDTVAPVASHAIPFYNSMSGAPEKAYLELRGASHFAPTSTNTTIAVSSIAWLKRFVDDDTRYDQFLCPPPGTSTAISDYRSTCPNS